MTVLIRSILFFLFLSGIAAAGVKPFNQDEFDRLQHSGAPVLIWIHADWCPTCRAQQPIIDKLIGQPDFKQIQVFKVDFDQQKKIVMSFKAIRQSTLIVFKGDKEIDRSLGVTDEKTIEDLLRKII
jgi:thioredoxin 1